MEKPRGEAAEIVRESESTSDSMSNLITSRGNGEETRFHEGFAEEFTRALRLEPMAQENDAEEEGDGGDDDAEDEEEEFEFAFVCDNPEGLLISAEEAFVDGQIRPFYPVFGRNILMEEDSSQSSSSSSVMRGILVEDRMRNPSSSSASSSSDGGDPLEGLADGTYCVWGKGRPADAVTTKSNSTGFSRLWRVKDLVMRSNSDGKDAFVFLNPKKPKDNPVTMAISAPVPKPVAKSNNGGKAKAKAATTGKDGRHEYPGRIDKNRRRSYLPYRVGFFTNINGISRNVHPY